MYFSQDIIKNMTALVANFPLKEGFFDSFLKMKQEGMKYDEVLFPISILLTFTNTKKGG